MIVTCSAYKSSCISYRRMYDCGRLPPRWAQKHQRTALHWAVFGGNTEGVRALIAAGADIAAVDSVRPFFPAPPRRSRRALPGLPASGRLRPADASPRHPTVITMLSRLQEGGTPLMYAVSFDFLEIAGILCAHGPRRRGGEVGLSIEEDSSSINCLRQQPSVVAHTRLAMICVRLSPVPGPQVPSSPTPSPPPSTRGYATPLWRTPRTGARPSSPPSSPPPAARWKRPSLWSSPPAARSRRHLLWRRPPRPPPPPRRSSSPAPTSASGPFSALRRCSKRVISPVGRSRPAPRRASGGPASCSTPPSAPGRAQQSGQLRSSRCSCRSSAGAEADATRLAARPPPQAGPPL